MEKGRECGRRGELTVEGRGRAVQWLCPSLPAPHLRLLCKQSAPLHCPAFPCQVTAGGEGRGERAPGGGEAEVLVQVGGAEAVKSIDPRRRCVAAPPVPPLRSLHPSLGPVSLLSSASASGRLPWATWLSSDWRPRLLQSAPGPWSDCAGRSAPPLSFVTTTGRQGGWREVAQREGRRREKKRNGPRWSGKCSRPPPSPSSAAGAPPVPPLSSRPGRSRGLDGTAATTRPCSAGLQSLQSFLLGP